MLINPAIIQSSIFEPIFDLTLEADATTIDTGANGIVSGYNILEILVIARTTEAVDISSFLMRVNNDSSAIYDEQVVSGANITATANITLVSTSWGHSCPGSLAETGAAAVLSMWLPGYTQTTFHKVATALLAVPDDTANNNRSRAISMRWKNTAAINRMSIAAGSGNLLAGSRLLIYGR